MGTLTKNLLRTLLVVAIATAGMTVSAPAAHADGTCTASGTIQQIPPTILNPNPTVTFTGDATCSTTHWMGITTHLTLDCGFSCSDVATGGGDAGWAKRTSLHSSTNYSPSACDSVPTTLGGETHTWYLFVYLYAEPLSGPAGWHSASGFATLPFSCPGALTRSTGGSVDVDFSVSTTLPTYPCPGGCSTTFGGMGTGAGHALGGGTTPTEATFAISSASVTGSATYTEPGAPICPALGSAVGSTTLTASGSQVTGVARRESQPASTGSVTQVRVNAAFTYQRIGALAALTVTSASVTVWYSIPGVGSGSYTVPADAAFGSAVFVVEPVAAHNRCTNPGPLPISLIGAIGIAIRPQAPS